jgi:hypothetical protein
MLFSGYLTVKETLNETMFTLRILNKEIQNLFKELFVILFLGEVIVLEA